MADLIRESFIEVIPEQPCPGCGLLCDSFTQVATDDTPKSGDHIVCIGCGKLLEYDGMKLIEGDATTLSVENARLVANLQARIAKLHRAADAEDQ